MLLLNKLQLLRMNVSDVTSGLPFLRHLAVWLLFPQTGIELEDRLYLHDRIQDITLILLEDYKLRGIHWSFGAEATMWPPTARGVSFV